jgi:hypothetical protein
MDNNPILYNDILGDKVRGKSKKHLKKYQSAIIARQTTIAREIANETALDVPDKAKIKALNSINNDLRNQLNAIQQIEGSNLLYQIKKSDKYPLADDVSRNPETAADGDFGINQKKGYAILAFHKDATDFNLTMSQLVITASLFDKGQLSVNSDENNSIAWDILRSVLTDETDLNAILSASGSWEVNIQGNQNLTNDVANVANGINNAISMLRNRNSIHSGDRSLHGDLASSHPADSYGNRGSMGAQGTQSYLQYFNSPAFNQMKKTIIYYDGQGEGLNNPSSSSKK